METFHILLEGHMDQKRILELAVEELKRQKAGIDAEIEIVRAELRGSGTPGGSKAAATTISKRRPRTPAQRRAQSLRMRKHWAAKRMQEAKAKKPTPPNLKIEKATASKAISEGMRAYWAKKKAETASRTAKAKPKGNKVPKQPSKA
jgi:hypothetical protein